MHQRERYLIHLAKDGETTSTSTQPSACPSRKENEMKSFIAHCRFHGTILTIAMYLARWSCGQPITITDDEGDHRISSDDYHGEKA
jgi:hypothetical protein